jgi:hypothetical protein
MPELRSRLGQLTSKSHVWGCLTELLAEVTRVAGAVESGDNVIIHES